jgi:hypothetical protein
MEQETQRLDAIMDKLREAAVNDGLVPFEQLKLETVYALFEAVYGRPPSDRERIAISLRYAILRDNSEATREY